MMRGKILLAIDFDGTLAPIRDEPGEAELQRGAAALLSQATQTEGLFVAVVSGREAADVASRIDHPAAYIIGSHGLEIMGPGGVLVREASPLDIEVDSSLRDEILVSGLRLESKKHGIALHWRGIPYPAIAPVVDAFREWAQRVDLDLIEGRCVVEARRRGEGKGQALRWLADAIGAAYVVYAGDDAGEFGPLRFVSERGLAVFIGSDELAAPPDVKVVESLGDLVQILREEVMI